MDEPGETTLDAGIDLSGGNAFPLHGEGCLKERHEAKVERREVLQIDDHQSTDPSSFAPVSDQVTPNED